MHAILFILGFSGILAGLSFLLYKLQVSPVFILTHAVLGCVYLSIAVWEAATKQSVGIGYLTGLWIITGGFIVTMPFILYLGFKFERRDIWSYKEAGMLGLLVLGCAMFYGFLEDFSCFIIWGLEYFNPTYAYWFPPEWWFLGVVPYHYLFLGIPGIILIVISLWWSRRVVESTTQASSNGKLLAEIRKELEKVNN